MPDSSAVLKKLGETEKKYCSLEELLALPETFSNIPLYTSTMKEYRSLTPVITRYRDYMRMSSEAEEAEALSQDSSDPELRAMAAEELYDLREKLSALENELTGMLLARDPNDDRNVVVEIRAGAGGEEACLFAAVLYRMYSMYCEKSGFRISVADANEAGLGGFRALTFTVEGDGAYSRFKFESGVHRVQRVPQTESQGRIQTSTVTVAVLPEADDVDIEILPQDLEFETCKSSGAGGQHINKTESAVRITHKPSVIVVECQEERSQFKNRDKALKLLRAKLYDIKMREQTDKIAAERRTQVGSGDRSEKIRTYNYPQNRVTDHRIGLTLYSLDSFLDGDIGGMVDALIAADTAEKLRTGDDTE